MAVKQETYNLALKKANIYLNDCRKLAEEIIKSHRKSINPTCIGCIREYCASCTDEQCESIHPCECDICELASKYIK